MAMTCALQALRGVLTACDAHGIAGACVRFEVLSCCARVVLPGLLVAAGRGAARSYAANGKAQAASRVLPLAKPSQWPSVGAPLRLGCARCYE